MESAQWRQRLACSAAFVVALVLVYVTVIHTVLGQRMDDMTLGLQSWLGPAGGVIATVRSPLLAVCVTGAGAMIVWALIRRNVLLATSAATVLLAVAALNPFLRDVALSRPPLDPSLAYTQNTFPSSHVAGAVACAAVVIALSPRTLPPPLLLALALIPLIEAVSSLASFAHRGSDVVGGALVAGIAVPWILGTRLPIPSSYARRVGARGALATFALLAVGFSLVAVEVWVVGGILAGAGLIALFAFTVGSVLATSPRPVPQAVSGAPASPSGR